MSDVIMMSEENIRKYTAIIKGLLANNETAVNNLKNEMESDYLSQDDFEDSPINFDDI